MDEIIFKHVDFTKKATLDHYWSEKGEQLKFLVSNMERPSQKFTRIDPSITTTSFS